MVWFFNLYNEFSFVEGTFMGDAPLNSDIICALGHYAGQLDRALLDFDHVALRARIWEWDLQSVQLNKKYLDAIASPKKRNLVSYFFQQYESRVLPLLPQLRKATIHNDLNEWNILVQGNGVFGVIDFGDCTHSQLINEVAIMATYVFYASEEPLQWAEPLLGSYHNVLPLEEKEISLLYYLIAMRL